MARYLVETSINLILDHIQSNIAGALSGVRSIRPDNSVTTEAPAPESYFIYPNARGYRPPAIFVIADDTDFRQEKTGANFIDAVDKINVSALIEDQDKQALTIKAYRYQAALHELLANTSILSADGKVKIVIIVQHLSFSPLYTNAKNEDSPEVLFRKEVRLDLDVEHYENF